MAALLRGVRDAWLIVGIAVVMFLALEIGYRAQGSFRRMLRGDAARPAPPAHPHAGERWFELFAEGGDRAGGGSGYDPYRGYWPNWARSPVVNIDSSGRRVTPQPPHDGGYRRRVLLLGGSTMWGWIAPDSGTIPFFVARGLHEAGRPDAEVVNVAQSMYNLTQGLITLNLELAHGRVPDVAVFLDGNNDVAAAWQNGVAGTVINQRLSEQAYWRGRRGMGAEITGLARHSELIARIRRAVSPQPEPEPPPFALCNDVAGHYAGVARSILGTAREFGFDVVLLWQPLLATTRKARSAFEASLEPPAGFAEFQRACAASVDSAMADLTGTAWWPLHSMFDADTATMYTDWFGHLTLAGNARVAARIVELVLPRLDR